MYSSLPKYVLWDSAYVSGPLYSLQIQNEVNVRVVEQRDTYKRKHYKNTPDYRNKKKFKKLRKQEKH